MVLYSEVSLKMLAIHQQPVLNRQMGWLHVLTGTVFLQHITAYEVL